MTDRRTVVGAVAGALLAASLACAAQAPGYPSKPIRLVVPFPPGAGTDTVARFVAQKLGEAMKATIVVDNRTGAGGAIGAIEVAKADPDGYTLLFVAGPFTTVAAASKNATYDPVRQFAAVAPIATSPLVFVVNPSVPASSMREFIALAKREPGKLNYGSAGPASINHLANPYFQAYWEALEGAPKADGGPIKGIETPSKHEIVFHLTEPKGQLVADAMVMPLTAAVPKEYAEKFDKHKPSDYGNYQVATGPYMFKNNAEGKVLGIGYVPGKSATLVRNPNWVASTDFRPAYLNEIQIKIGGTNSVIGRQVLEGTNIIENEPPAQSNVRLADEKYKSQLEISPGAGSHYISLNNAKGVFTNVNLRKAFWAALDRKAMDRARGGELVTTVMTHFIYPTIPGFEQSGGLAGPKFDFNEHPEGDTSVAEKYMKLAGYPSGKYTGSEQVTVVGSKGNPAEQDAEIVNQTLKNLGFNTKFTLVETATMYAKYCNVPKEEIDVCPSVGWIADFADPQTVLDITFNGKFINATGNVNWPQLNNPKINAAMTAAESVKGVSARASAWAKIDEEVVENAAAVPFDWDKQANIEGSEVHGVGDLWDVGEWDYSWTSLK